MLIISDANIFIDMDCAGLTAKMFRLPETFAVPDVLFMEELREMHPELPAYGLQVKALGERSVVDAVQLFKYRELSQNDVFALALARQEASTLLTGDRRLREAAQTEGVDVRGTLWLMKRLFDERVIGSEEAAGAYAKMRAANRRLPWTDVDKQLKGMTAHTRG
mgnify:CR=1 FL=1